MVAFNAVLSFAAVTLLDDQVTDDDFVNQTKKVVLAGENREAGTREQLLELSPANPAGLFARVLDVVLLPNLPALTRTVGDLELDLDVTSVAGLRRLDLGLRNHQRIRSSRECFEVAIGNTVGIEKRHCSSFLT